MLWVVFSILSSMGRAASRLSNQYFQLPGIFLIVANKFLLLVYTLPFVFFIKWPSDPLFYVLLLVQAPIAVYQDKKNFELTAKHGAGVVTRIEPLSIVLLFFAWMAVTPSLFSENFENPLRFTGILLALSAISYFALRLRKCEINFTVFKEMIPLIIGVTCISMLGKAIIDRAESADAVVIYVFVQSLIMIAVALLFNNRTKNVSKDTFVNFGNWQKAALLSFVMLIGISGRILAFRFVENPAYVNAIVLMAPVWVVMFYKFVKHKEEGDIKSGFGIVASAIILTLLVQSG